MEPATIPGSENQLRLATVTGASGYYQIYYCYYYFLFYYLCNDWFYIVLLLPLLPLLPLSHRMCYVSFISPALFFCSVVSSFSRSRHALLHRFSFSSCCCCFFSLYHFVFASLLWSPVLSLSVLRPALWLCLAVARLVGVCWLLRKNPRKGRRKERKKREKERQKRRKDGWMEESRKKGRERRGSK